MLVKHYYVSAYRDSFRAFYYALKKAGYRPTEDAQVADFLFFDHEPIHLNSKREGFENLAQNRPTFIYPHTPYAFWLWDGYVKPSEHIRCNFVMSSAAVLSMKEYGYKRRVENVGFSRCQILPFKPTSGKRLVYAPARLIGTEGRWPHPGDKELHEKAWNWILENKHFFDEVVFYVTHPLKYYEVEETPGVKFIEVGPPGKLNTTTALRQLKIADVVVSCNSFGYLAIARGIPTVLFGHNSEVEMHSSNYGKHYKNYEKFCGFPLDLFQLNGREVLELRNAPSSKIEKWKKMNIGRNFDGEKFVKIVKEYL